MLYVWNAGSAVLVSDSVAEKYIMINHKYKSHTPQNKKKKNNQIRKWKMNLMYKIGSTRTRIKKFKL